ncbi:hypothetical protein [Agrobacterium tumefaciens]|uniref:hypothetical protein n=1 Tax=Agrobacterium tumefaciens TaxID=358 RepID=UPI001865A2B2|nr:hypothetical protein [Agrobacterium tumefaciens]
MPSLAKDDPKGRHIDYGQPSGFEIKQYEHDPIFSVNEQNSVVHSSLKRDSCTPVAVLKYSIRGSQALRSLNGLGIVRSRS